MYCIVYVSCMHVFEFYSKIFSDLNLETVATRIFFFM